MNYALFLNFHLHMRVFNLFWNLSQNIFTSPNLKAYASSSLRHSLLGLDQCTQIQNKGNNISSPLISHFEEGKKSTFKDLARKVSALEISSYSALAS